MSAKAPDCTGCTGTARLYRDSQAVPGPSDRTVSDCTGTVRLHWDCPVVPGLSDCTGIVILHWDCQHFFRVDHRVLQGSFRQKYINNMPFLDKPYRRRHQNMPILRQISGGNDGDRPYLSTLHVQTPGMDRTSLYNHTKNMRKNMRTDVVQTVVYTGTIDTADI